MKLYILLLSLFLTSCNATPVTATTTEKRCLNDLEIHLKGAKASFLDKRYACITIAKSAQESACRASAKSKFAIGNDQFTISTVLSVSKGVCRDLGVVRTKSQARKYALDKVWSIKCSARYLAQLYRSCIKKGFESGTQAMGCATAAYNAGLGWILKEQKVAKQRGLDYTQYFGVVDRICLRASWACKENQGSPPEYRGYAKRILGDRQPRFARLGVPCVNFLP